MSNPHYKAISTAEQRRAVAWHELQVSADKFQQSELAFDWRTDKVRREHDLKPTDELTVEAIIDRKNDEQWQTAVADCRYYARRMTAYGALHQAAIAELRILRG